MYMYFPTWLRHGRPNDVTSVFGVDIQPNGTRLATCGQDCAIKLWDLSVISAQATHQQQNPSDNAPPPAGATGTSLSKKSEKLKSQIPPTGALLTTLTTHTAAVNVVRWSPDGKFLASAGDDAIILLHYLVNQQQSAFGLRTQQLESWVPKRPLRAHNSDIHDLAWSPDNQRLASASVDNSIIVWSLKSDMPVIKLQGHTGYVKGVAWDPIGRYIISQSDDRSVRIWRNNDWKCEKVITKPFENAVFQENSLTFFLRISWSPCAQFFAATNAYRKPSTHHAPMFSRVNGFSDQPVEFVGHREPVISSRFSPCLYRKPSAPTKNIQINGKTTNLATAAASTAVDTANKKDKDKDKDSFYTVLSLGSKDGGCSIWQATAQTPFVNLYDAFDMEVIDISWGSDGYTMVACSPDGKILFAKFTPDELGEVISAEETRKILTEQWRSLGGKTSTNEEVPLPESVVQLNLEQVEKQREQQQKQLDQGGAINKPPKIPKMDTNNSTKPTPTPPSSNLNNDNQVIGSMSSSLLPTSFSATAEAVKQNPTPPADPKLIAAQNEVRVRGGKRRITPVSVTPMAPEEPVDNPTPVLGNTSNTANGNGVGNSTYQPIPIEVSETVPVPNNNPLKRPRSNGNMSIDKPDGSLGKFARSEAQNKNALSNGGSDNVVINKGTSEMGTMLRDEQERLGIVPPGAQPVSHASSLYAPSIIGLSMMLLPERSHGPGASATGSGTPTAAGGLDSQHNYRGRCRVLRSGDHVMTIESRELNPGAAATPKGVDSGFVLTCSKGGKVKWKDYHTKGGFVTALAGVYDKFVAAATSDGYLFLYSAASGRRLTPPIVLDSAPYMLETFSFDKLSERWFALVITRSATCSVYDVRARTLVAARSAACLLARPREMDGASGPSAGDDDADDDGPDNTNAKAKKGSGKGSGAKGKANNNSANNNGNGGAGTSTINLGNQARIVREVAHADVTRDGEPMLTLSDGQAFAYGAALCSWVRVTDDSLPNSEYKRHTAADHHRPASLGVVRYLQGRSAGLGPGVPLSAMGDAKRAAVESLAHLESLMESCKVLAEARDFRYYLATYAACIATAVADDVEGSVLRLREVCDDLLGAAHPEQAHVVVNMDARQLLADVVLPVVAKNRHLQRLVVEYSDALKEIRAITANGKSMQCD